MRFTLFTKPGCCLCDEAKSVLDEWLRAHPGELDQVDISSDPALMKNYGERIPVVLVDGVEHFQYKVHPKRLQQLVQLLEGRSESGSARDQP